MRGSGTLTFITLPRPSDLRRIGASVAYLLTGRAVRADLGLLRHPASCASWVALALAVSFVSGLLADARAAQSVARPHVPGVRGGSC